MAVSADLVVQDRTGQVADRDVLVRALAALAPKQRAVPVLRYWEDVPDAEIAAALNCGEGTVRSQASRALARLRELCADSRPLREQYSARSDDHE